MFSPELIGKILARRDYTITENAIATVAMPSRSPLEKDEVDMRWIWIDRFVDFVSGERASAIRNITLAEDYLDNCSGCAVMPPSLMIEGMAQTAGILVGELRGFAENVILAKIRLAEFEDYAGPGDQLRYDAVLESLDDRAGVTSGTVRKNGAPIGRVNLIFSHVDNARKTIDLPDHNFVFTEQFVSLLKTIRKSDTEESESLDGR